MDEGIKRSSWKDKESGKITDQKGGSTVLNGELRNDGELTKVIQTYEWYV